MDYIMVAITVLLGLGLGVLAGYFGRKFFSAKRYREAEQEASLLLESAKGKERTILLEAKEEALKMRFSAESESRRRRTELQDLERRLTKREENSERRANNLDRRERTIAEMEKSVEDLQETAKDIETKQIQRLEEISDLSLDVAKDELMRHAEEKIQHELAIRHRDMEERARDEANKEARNILALSIQRLASDVVSEATLSSVPIPTDDMKGRLIGREGRNIKALEKATGVDLIVDDTPEAVTISCFDPIRREVARLAIAKLVSDGRIQPTRIEETVTKTEKELDETILKAGEETLLDVGVQGINSDLRKLLGRLKYRFSYGENVLQHSIEVAHLSAMIAAEIGADVKVAKTGGLLHDIGKALTHEIEGPHAEIGAEAAAKGKIPSQIVATIAEHHDDHHSSAESFIVAAADAISAARPGSRRDTVEQYIKRLEALENVAREFDGVERCFAIQAGREIRILVKPEDVDDLRASEIARGIVKKIEA